VILDIRPALLIHSVRRKSMKAIYIPKLAGDPGLVFQLLNLESILIVSANGGYAWRTLSGYAM
jgi:hypothetical protein